MAGYGDDAGFAQWLTDNGLTAPAGSVPAARNRGSAFVDTYEPKFPGTRTGGYAQGRAWPRTGATTYYGEVIPSDVIPVPVVQASYYAAYQELQSPGSLSPVVVGSETVKREKVGSLEVEYASGTTAEEILAMSQPNVMAIDGLLWPFLYARCVPYAAVV